MTNKEKRDQRRIQELGTRLPKCQLCGETDITAIRKAKGFLLEEHHIAGNHVGETILVCRNCHAKLTDKQLEWPKEAFAENPSPELQAATFFMGLAELLFLLAEWCKKYALKLFEYISQAEPGDASL